MQINPANMSRYPGESQQSSRDNASCTGESAGFLSLSLSTWGTIFVLTLVLPLWIYLLGGPFWHSDQALIFRDIPRMGIPNLAFLQEALFQGFIPYLDPGRGGGMPFILDPQTCAWYPPAWLAALFQPESGFRLFQFFHLLWLGLGFAVLVHSQTLNRPAALFASLTAIGTVPHLHALEWMPIMAGLSWVPWGLWAASQGHLRLWVLALSLGILSGHAYLWVMTPILFLAGCLLTPRVHFKTWTLLILSLILVTFPVWSGYLEMASEFRSHSLQTRTSEDITSFSPIHLLGFLSPRTLRDFLFGDRQGRVREIRQWGDFGWARQCYLGLLPILLIPLGVAFTHTLSEAAVLLFFGGLVMAMFPPFLAPHFPEMYKHMHHPATFILLSTWGLIFLGSIGVSRLDFSSLRLYRSRILILILGLAATLGIHQLLAEAALDGTASPLWHFSFQTSQLSYLLGFLFLLLGLSGGFLTKNDTSAGLGVIVLPLVLSLHLGDLYQQSRPVLPITAPATVSKVSWRAGVASPARVLVVPQVQQAVLRIPGQPNPEFLSQAYEQVRQTAVPLIEREQGLHHLADYNPPFIHSGREAWIKHLLTQPAATRNTLFRLTGIGRLITDQPPTATETPSLQFPPEFRLPPLYSEDIASPSMASLISIASFTELLSAGTTDDTKRGLKTPELEKVSWQTTWDSSTDPFTPLQLTWQDSEALIQVSAVASAGMGIFVPVLPLQGWQARSGDRNLEIERRPDFGIFIQLSPEVVGTVRLFYRPRLWPHLAFLPLLGLFLLFSLRPRPVVQTAVGKK